MQNPLKRIQAMFKPAPRRQGLDAHLSEKLDHSECMVIWPNGTWKSHLLEPQCRPDPDGVVRFALLTTWAIQELLAAEAVCGHKLNPGMFSAYTQSLPKGWKPSEKILKHVRAGERWVTDPLHHIVGQLKHTGRLAA